MNKENRNILLTCGVILLIVILCLSVVIAIGAGIFLVSPKNQVAPTSTLPLPTPLPTSSTGSDLDMSIATQMDLIQSQVIVLRGLDPTQAISRMLLSGDQLRENVINDFLSEYTPQDAQRDARVLHLLGLLPPGFDLVDFYTELYSEQIAGYYDNEAQAMYVVQGTAFGGNERMTYAHEYVHVLQDQAFDFIGGLKYDDENCEADSERCAGIQALIEGDATLTELKWFQEYSTQQDYEDIMEFYQAYQSPVYDRAPNYMQKDFMFPYEKGQQFVQHLFDRGGYKAINNAYTNVPVSTEQILHPEKYPYDKPLEVELPDLSSALGPGWQETERNVMGEWYTYLLLAHGYDPQFRVPEQKAEDAAEGWGGDTYLVYENENTAETVFVMVSLFDTTRDLDQYVSTFKDYGDLRWGNPADRSKNESLWQKDGIYSLFINDAESTTWIMAPRMDLLQSIRQTLP